MSGELKASEEWVRAEPAPKERRRWRRKKKAPPVTRSEVLLAGLKRIALVLVISCALLTGTALLLVHYSEMAASRAFPLVFYGGGALLAFSGFAGATTGPSMDWMPVGGYDHEDRARGMSNAIVYGGFGVALIIVGAVLDAKL
jgi:hypothetical protein